MKGARSNFNCGNNLQCHLFQRKKWIKWIFPCRSDSQTENSIKYTIILHFDFADASSKNQLGKEDLILRRKFNRMSSEEGMHFSRIWKFPSNLGKMWTDTYTKNYMYFTVIFWHFGIQFFLASLDIFAFFFFQTFYFHFAILIFLSRMFSVLFHPSLIFYFLCHYCT